MEQCAVVCQICQIYLFSPPAPGHFQGLFPSVQCMEGDLELEPQKQGIDCGDDASRCSDLYVQIMSTFVKRKIDSVRSKVC